MESHPSKNEGWGTRRFHREFPTKLVLTLPEKELRKMRGQYKYKVSQQDKLVDQCIRTLVEEAMVESVQQHGRRVSQKQIRGSVQKRLAALNRSISEKSQKTLQQSYEAARRVLGGGK